jgi:general secretion pathway protein K
MRGPRGSVLVIVLVTVLFAAAALVAFTEKAGDDLIVESREIIAKRLRQEAYSALEVTLAVLEDFRLVNSGLHSPAEGWSDPLAFAGWTPREGLNVEISFEDESGKLSLPKVEPAVLLNLFQEWELPQSDAERLVDVLFSWMRKDHVASTSHVIDYERGALPYGPPLRSLRNYSELAAIDFAREVFFDEAGRPNERFQRFSDAVSLLEFNQTNVNGAAADAVLALGSLDRSQQRQMEDYLRGTGSRAQQGPGYFPSTAEAASILGVKELPAGYGAEISALRIHVRVIEGRSVMHLSVVVAPQGGAKAVTAVAATTSAEVDETKTTGDQNATSGGANRASGQTAGAAKKLNYPFTLLEIRENTEISAVPVPAPKA